MERVNAIRMYTWQESRNLYYGKRNIVRLLLEDISKSVAEQPDWFEEMVQKLDCWWSTDFTYQSKVDRMSRLVQIGPEDVIILMLVSLLRYQSGINLQTIAISLGKLLGFEEQEAVTTGAEILTVLDHPGLYELCLHSNGIQVEHELAVEEDTQALLDGLLYPPPQVTYIDPWTKNAHPELGYIVLGNAGKLWKHTKHQAYDALNILQDTPLYVDVEAAMYANPLEDMNEKAQDTIISELAYTPFYMPWKYDSRGRMYDQGYHIHVQGTNYDKSIISLAPEPVYDHEAIAIGIAGHAGQDKGLWSERIKWVRNNIDHDRLLGEDYRHYIEEVCQDWDEPHMGMKSLRAYRDVLLGEPTGYMVGLDATASGIQCLALLSGCKKTAGACNLINTGIREDIYTMLMGQMNLHLDEGDYVDRKLVKRPLMTH